MHSPVEPEICLVLTCFEEAELLSRAVDSILAQTDPHFNTLLVFDAGDEATQNLARKHAREHGFQLIEHTQNQGLSAARNTGFAHAADWVMPLDADDALPPTAVADLRAAIHRFPESDFFFGNYRIVRSETDQQSTDCSSIAEGELHGGPLNPFKLTENWSLLGTSPCRKKVWEAVGGYDLAFTNTVQDLDFWRRVLLNGAQGRWINREMYHWYRTETGMNASVKEEDLLPLRIKSLPFYEKFNPALAKHYADYLYRYFSHRRLREPLLGLLKAHPNMFKIQEKVLAYAMPVQPLYSLLYRFFKH